MASPRPNDAVVSGRQIHNELVACAQAAPDHPAARAVWAADAWLRSQPDGEYKVEGFLKGWGVLAERMGGGYPDRVVAALRVARADGAPFGPDAGLATAETLSATDKAAARLAQGDPRPLQIMTATVALGPVLVAIEDKGLAASGVHPCAQAHRKAVEAGAPVDGPLARFLSAVQAAPEGGLAHRAGTALARAVALSPNFQDDAVRLDFEMAKMVPQGILDTSSMERALERRGADTGAAASETEKMAVRTRAAAMVGFGMGDNDVVDLGRSAATFALGPSQMAKAAFRFENVTGPQDAEAKAQGLADRGQAEVDAIARRFGGLQPKVEAEQPKKGGVFSFFSRAPAGAVEAAIDPNAPEVLLGLKLHTELLAGAKAFPLGAMAAWATHVQSLPTKEALAHHASWGRTMMVAQPGNPEGMIEVLAKARESGRALEGASVSMMGTRHVERPDEVTKEQGPTMSSRAFISVWSAARVRQERALRPGPDGKPVPTYEVLDRLSTLAERQGLDPDGPIRQVLLAARLHYPSPDQPPTDAAPPEGASVVAGFARAVLETPAVADRLESMDKVLARHMPKQRLRLDEMTHALTVYGVRDGQAGQVALARIQRDQAHIHADPGAAERMAETLGRFVLAPQKMRDNASALGDKNSRRAAYDVEKTKLVACVQDIKTGSERIHFFQAALAGRTRRNLDQRD
jgi:hypothetical protein